MTTNQQDQAPSPVAEPSGTAQGADPFAELPFPLAPIPWWVRLRFWIAQRWADAVCAARGHRMQWYGGVVDYETGETDADYQCARCGRGESDGF